MSNVGQLLVSIPIVHTRCYGLELAHYFGYARPFLVDQQDVYMVGHHHAVGYYKAVKACGKCVNAFFYHTSGFVQAQLAVVYAAEKFTPVFGHHCYEITSIAGIIITFQP